MKKKKKKLPKKMHKKKREFQKKNLTTNDFIHIYKQNYLTKRSHQVYLDFL